MPEVYLWSAQLAQTKYSFANADKRYAKLLQMRPKYPDAVVGRAAIAYQSTHKLDEVEKMLTETFTVNLSDPSNPRVPLASARETIIAQAAAAQAHRGTAALNELFAEMGAKKTKDWWELQSRRL